MSSVKKLQFSIRISAPVEKVFYLMLDAPSYQQWTSAFCEGSYYLGSWEQGKSIRFLSPSGDGMISEIAENRPNEFISIRHLGYIMNGIDDTESEAIRAWAPAYENYTFHSTPEGTELIIDQDVTEEYESYIREAWPKSLQLLKALCEE